MTWISLILIDLIYVCQFIIFIQWYYPKTIIVTGFTTSFMIIETIIASIEMITCFLFTIYNVRKALKE